MFSYFLIIYRHLGLICPVGAISNRPLFEVAQFSRAIGNRPYFFLPSGTDCVYLFIYGVNMFIISIANDTPSG